MVFVNKKWSTRNNAICCCLTKIITGIFFSSKDVAADTAVAWLHSAPNCIAFEGCVAQMERPI